jgi:hypothetical protein
VLYTVFDYTSHGEITKCKTGGPWGATQFLHGDQSTSGIFHGEKRKHCAQSGLEFCPAARPHLTGHGAVQFRLLAFSPP